ncbi:GntR family transcriptional regulator [Actinomycetaceae bacterium L2_0104]
MSQDEQDLDQPRRLDITVDRDSSTPLHMQVSEPITQLIVSGELAPGQLIEDEVTLANRLSVSRPTVRRAFQDMVNAGLLTRRRGVGTRVTPSHIRRKIGLTSLHDDLDKAGLSPRTDVLSYNVQLADESLARLLECKEGAEVVLIERLRWSKDTPLALMHNILPAKYAPSLTELNAHGLYNCLAKRGIRPTNAVQSVAARLADAREADLLQIDEGAALLTTQRSAYSEAGELVDYGRHVYDASQYQVTFSLHAE